MDNSEILKEWIEKNVVTIAWGEYSGVKDLTIADLGALQALVKAALTEKIRQISEIKEEH